MPIIAREFSNGGFADRHNITPPAPGIYQAVCADVIDLGIEEDKFNPGKMKHKVRIAWILADDKQPDGKHSMVSNWYTLSMNEKATLRKHAESWLGRQFSKAELQRGFDLETLIGANCSLVITNKTNQETGKISARISAVAPLAKGVTPFAVPDTYVRDKDREKRDGAPHPSEEPIPF